MLHLSWVYIVLTRGGPSNRKALLQIVVAVWRPHLCLSTEKDPLCLLRCLNQPLNQLLRLRLSEPLVHPVSF